MIKTRATGMKILLAACAISGIAASPPGGGTSFAAMTPTPSGTAIVPLVAQRHVDERRPASADAEIEIYNLAGSLRIVGWDRHEVRVTGTLGKGTEELEFDGDEDDIDVRVVVPRRRGGQWDSDLYGSDLEIHVPSGSSLDVETLSASIDISGISGALSLESVSGAVDVSGGSDEIDVETTSGKIGVRTSSSTVELDLKSVSGLVVVRMAGGEISASTVSGNIEVIAEDPREAECESVSGNIRFEGDFSSRGSYQLDNFSGNVEVLVSADASARFEISSFSGGIENDFGHEPRRTERYTPEKELEFSLGSGASHVSVETFSGSVEIRKR
ncbi:MAG: DUF4097 domain-containing protein [Acidobacteriota bacterium]